MQHKIKDLIEVALNKEITELELKNED